MQQRGDWLGALTIYRALLAVEPAHPQILHLLASALTGAGQTTEAIACYRRMASTGEAPAEARMALAGLLNSTGDYAEAATNAAAALAILETDPKKEKLAKVARDELSKAQIMAKSIPLVRSFRRAAGRLQAPEKINIVYFHIAAPLAPNATCEGVDYPGLIAMSAETARRRMPGARIVLMTDDATEFPGLDADLIIRRTANPDLVVFERTQMQRAYVASAAFDADSILVDSDVVFHGDARSAFTREFDLAYTVRAGFELMPFNVGVVFMRCAARTALLRYLDTCIAGYDHLDGIAAVRELYPHGIRRWWGDQLVPAAMVGWDHCARDILRDGYDLASVGDTQIGFLPPAIFNCDADAAHDANSSALSGKLVLHFKGARKDDMRHYVDSLAGQDAGRVA